MVNGRLLSVRVGRPRELVDGQGRTWTSAFLKDRVQGKVFLGSHNLEGDEQADLSVHGGPDKAVCVYSAQNHPFWLGTLGVSDLPMGAFGENFTVSRIDEWSVCVGDVFAVGDAVVEVTQPRGPCWKLGRRWERSDLPQIVQASRRTGWYMRVLESGYVAAGDELVLAERRHPKWTIAEVNRLRYEDRDDLVGAGQIAELDQLSGRWRETFRKRLATGEEPDEPTRLQG